MVSVVQFILKEYTYISSATRQAKHLDSRVLVSGDLSAEVLRTAAIDSEEAFYWVWANYGDLFTVKQTLIDLCGMFAKRSYELYNYEAKVLTLLSHPTTLALVRAATEEDRSALRSQLPSLDYADSVLFDQRSPKWGWNDQLTEEGVESIFNLLKDSEVDHLHEMLASYCQGTPAAYLRWESQEERVALAMLHGSTLRVSELTPLGVAVFTKSLPVVKYLVEKAQAGVREHLQTGTYTVRGSHEFSTPVLPLLNQSRDIDTLNYLLRQPFFVVTPTDVLSFVALATSGDKPWHQGTKAFLQSPAASVVYQGL